MATWFLSSQSEVRVTVQWGSDSQALLLGDQAPLSG